ncbi:MAG: glycosyltransferase [Firmicutes bacterium]|jgi:glycosyltransferase involved in cell wall biosynthesis|nr:glycosyltransferase [Bacillota bacterium]
MTVAAVVPALNEETTVSDTVSALFSTGMVDEVVVVDDGSRDATAERARAAGARVIRLRRTEGKGAAVRAGLSATDSDVVALADADLGRTASEMSKVIAAVVDGRADMAVAGFEASRGRGGFGLVVRLARLGILALTGVALTWPLSGQRAFRRDLAAGLPPLPEGFGLEVGFAVDWARAGYSILEVPTSMRHRETGRDLRGFLHRGRQLWAVALTLLSRAVSRR